MPRVLVEFDRPSIVWIEESGGTEEVQRGPSWRRVDLALRPRENEAALDLALRSASFLFHLPLSLAGRGWDLRSKHAVSSFQDRQIVEFETSVHGVPYAFGPFLVPGEELADLAKNRAARLDHLYYLSRHTAERRGPYEVRLRDFLIVDGIPVAMRREHAFLEPGEPRPPAHPLELPVRPPTTWVRTETISEIRFLDRDGLREILAPGPPADVLGSSGIVPR